MNKNYASDGTYFAIGLVIAAIAAVLLTWIFSWILPNSWSLPIFIILLVIGLVAVLMMTKWRTVGRDSVSIPNAAAPVAVVKAPEVEAPKAKPEPEAKPKPAPKAEPAPKAKAKPATKPKPKKATKPKAKAEASRDGKPKLLTKPRGGKADDLKKIKGVGPKLESELNGAGVFHYDQIAGWSKAEVEWADENLVSFKGRVSRDNWVDQAKELAK